MFCSQRRKWQDLGGYGNEIPSWWTTEEYRRSAPLAPWIYYCLILRHLGKLAELPIIIFYWFKAFKWLEYMVFCEAPVKNAQITEIFCFLFTEMPWNHLLNNKKCWKGSDGRIMFHRLTAILIKCQVNSIWFRRYSPARCADAQAQ